MRFMIIVKATRDSEAGVMPDEKILTTMANTTRSSPRRACSSTPPGLKPSSKGWRVKYAGTGKTQVVDGPFTEAKELIAGYTIINVKSREEALEWTRRFPTRRSTARKPRSRCGRCSSSRTLRQALRSIAFAKWALAGRSRTSARHVPRSGRPCPCIHDGRSPPANGRPRARN